MPPHREPTSIDVNSTQSNSIQDLTLTLIESLRRQSTTSTLTLQLDTCITLPKYGD